MLVIFSTRKELENQLWSDDRCQEGVEAGFLICLDLKLLEGSTNYVPETSNRHLFEIGQKNIQFGCWWVEVAV